MLRCHSLHHLKRTLENVRLKCTSTTSSFLISNPEEDFKCLRSSIRIEDKLQVEANVDCVLFSEILTSKPFLDEVVLETELRKSLTLEIQRKLDALDLGILRLRRFHDLCQLALIYLNIFLTKNRTRTSYIYIRKAFSYLHFARYSDISRGNLTLATTYYCLGRFNTALRYIKNMMIYLVKALVVFTPVIAHVLFTWIRIIVKTSVDGDSASWKQCHWRYRTTLQSINQCPSFQMK